VADDDRVARGFDRAVDRDVVLEDPMILILLVAAASTALCVALALKLVGDI